MLLPHRALGHRPYGNIPTSDPYSRDASAQSSRRTSISSEGGQSRYGPFASPFDDSRPGSRGGASDDEHVNTQTVSEKYNIMPSEGLLLFPEDVEPDDYLHNPDPNEKEERDCNIFTRRGFVNLGGLGFVVIGTLMLFVGWPVLYVETA